MQLSELFIKIKLKSEDFNKGVENVKQKLSTFASSIGSIGRQIASAFGLEGVVDKISSVSSGVGKFMVSLRGAAGGASIFSSAMKVIKAALISTGIGALVVALGTLVAYFTQTERGAEALERAMAGLKAIFKVLIDRAALFGEGVYKLFTGDFKGGWDKLKNSVSGIGAEMSKEGKIAMDLARRFQDVEDKERDLMVSIEKRKALAAQLRLDARDESIDAEKRQKMLQEAAALYKSVFKDEKEIAKEKADILQEQIQQGEVRDEQLLKLAELQTATISKDREEAETLKSLTREQKAVASAVKERAEAMKIAALKPVTSLAETPDKKQMNYKASFGEIQLQKLNGELADNMLLDTEGLNKFFDHIKEFTEKLKEVYKDPIEATKEFTKELSDGLKNGLTSAAFSLAAGLGELSVNAITGDDFGKQVLSIVGSFMVQLGTLMVTTSTIYAAFKASLAAGGWGSVALGFALIAAGAAVSGFAKTGLNGGGSSSGGGAASGYSPSSGQSHAGNLMNGSVVFELHGNVLKGALANTDRRNSNFR